MPHILDLVTNSAIENFREAFFDTTGMLLSFADTDHKQYNTFYSGSRCEFCKIMNSTEKGLEACISTSRQAGKAAARDKKVKIYKCHAGLTEVVVPILVNGEHIGSVFSGQVITGKPSEKDVQKLQEHLVEIGVDSNELREAFANILVVSESKLKIVSELLMIAVDFMTETEENNFLKEQVLKEKEKFNQFIPYIRNEIFNYIVNNNVDKLANVQETFELLGLKNEPNTVLVVRLDNYQRLSVNQGEKFKIWLNNKTMEILSNELSGMKDHLIFPIDDGKFIILLRLNKCLTAEKKKLASLDISERLRKTVETQMPCTASVGIGRYYDSSINLGNSYMEANSAQMYGNTVGRNQVIHIDDISDFHEERVYHSIEYGRLKDCIMLANKEKLNQIVTEIFTQFRVFPEKDINKIKAIGMEFLNQALNAAIECGLNSGFIIKKMEFFRQLDQLSTMDAIFDWVKNVLESIVNSMVNMRNSRDDMIIKHAKEYIDNNFAKDIRLEDVALEVFLSPNYFGALFKKVAKLTYVEYLTQIRMEKAKYLLETTTQSIQDISEKTGYNDPNYFSQVFNKYYRIRPSILRTQIGKKSGADNDKKMSVPS